MSFYRKSYRPRRGGEEPEKCADPAKARARALDARFGPGDDQHPAV